MDIHVIAQRLMALFMGHAGAHGTHGEPTQDPGKLKWEIKTTARTLREPVTIELWEQHVQGARPLGVITIREDNTCYWGSIDVDKYGDSLLDIVEKVEKHGYPLVVCQSKSGGIHLFLFLAEPQPAANVQAVLRDIAATLGLAGSEIFPKQTQVKSDRGDLGNWMVMPYFGSTYNGKLFNQAGLRKNGDEMSAEEFLDLAEGKRLTTAEFVALGNKRHTSPGGAKKGKANGTGENFDDGPPCLQHLAAEGVAEHQGRNAALFHMAIYYRKKDPSSWRAKLDEANFKYMKPPVSSDEVQQVVKSMEKKEYEYTCKVEPMCSHCDSIVCRSRKWGVGRDGDVPIIASMTKLDARPPIWFLELNGTRVELTTEELYRYDKFQMAHLTEFQVGNQLFTGMKQADWHAVINKALENLVVIESTDDISPSGRFHEYLEEFLTNRSRGKRREDLTTGKPWEDEEEQKHYFRLKDYQKYLQREDARDERGQRYTRGKIVNFIREFGGDTVFFNIRGKGVHTWWVPSGAVQAEPDVDPPPMEGSPI